MSNGNTKASGVKEAITADRIETWTIMLLDICDDMGIDTDGKTEGQCRKAVADLAPEVFTQTREDCGLKVDKDGKLVAA